MDRPVSFMPPLRQPATVSIDELTVIIGVSRRTIHRQIQAKQIKSIKLGQRRLVPLSEIDRILGGRAWRTGGAA